ncbi:acyltransferase family protein [uncultured Oscillibacter sp.]|jgi:serine/alanine racemase|uniref:acyltransferase family protein n=1 Tax=uncultured Oscillibacter sp. TaxID=876091 RepID=UPI00272E1389|nr:acyltransferase family protein [uncultured Oscillibacter sp.]
MRAGEVPRPGKFPALDDFRWIAVILVVANHTRSAEGPFLWLLTVLRRVAVPYFLMVSGYFLGRDGWRSTGRFLKRTALLYGVGVLLYLPLNWYAGQLSPDFPRQVVFDGSFYHLWYLPALLLGTPAAWLLSRLGRRKALLIAGGLYLIGLGGDSYYGLLPEGVTSFYDVVFQVFTYTRNGLFYVPLFLLLGAAGVTLGRCVSLAGFLISLSMLVSEALLLRGAGVQRFDSMYVCFPFLMVFLFSLLLNANRGERRELRRLTTLVSIAFAILSESSGVSTRLRPRSLTRRSTLNRLSEAKDILHNAVGVLHLAAYSGFAVFDGPLPVNGVVGNPGQPTRTAVDSIFDGGKLCFA